MPRVTVQMPVYLEGFEFVIKPSIFSLEAAIAAYRAEGGSASIFVNDDGLQLLNDEDRCLTITCFLAFAEYSPDTECDNCKRDLCSW